MNAMLKQFNLPNYIDGLSFADASKKIQAKFKERTDPESINTEKEMLDRLKQMQEHVKEQHEAKEEAKSTTQNGDMRAEDPESMQMEDKQPEQETDQEYDPEQEQFAFGGAEEPDIHAMPETAEQRFAPTIGANNVPIGASIMSIANTGSSFSKENEDNQMALGGDEDYYKNNNPYFTTNPGQVTGPQLAPTDSQSQQSTTQFAGSDTTEPASTESTTSGIGKPGAVGYAQMGVTAIELGQEALGPTGVDTSGRVHVEKKKAGNAAVAGAAKGASAGMVLGPWGAAAGAVIGGAAGFFGAKKQQKDAAIANRNATYADAAVNDNQFAFGGEDGPFGPKPKSVAETLMASSRVPNKKVVPAMNYDALDKQYKDFRMAKLDSISKNNQIMPSGKYVKLTGGRNKLAEIDTALLDAVEAAEKRSGLKRGDLGATINRESNYGGQYGKGMNYGKEVKKMGSTIDLLSMSNNYKGTDKYVGSEPLRHFADLKAPGVKTTKDFHGQYYQISDKKLLDEYIRKNPKSVEDYNKKLRSGPSVGKKNSLDFLADDMKAAGNTQKYRRQYNPGDKNYANLMEQDARDLQNEKAYNKYLDTNKFDMGGELNQFHKGGKIGHIHKPENKQVDKVKTVGYGNDGKFIKPSVSREMDADLMSLIKKESPDVTGVQDKFEEYYNEQEAKKPKSTFNKVKDAILDNKDALRYAPALGNVIQLAKLKKPEQETTPELNTRYKKNVVDEKGLVNLIREETAGNREAILSSSEGSGSAARANLLGTQLNATKALSDAFMKSQEANARENFQEQSFNLGVDTTNLQQQTLAQDIRARNKGAYDTEKSRLQTAVASDLGSIGQEELYKKFPELMGADYDWKGRYKKLKDQVDKEKSK